MKKCLSIVLVVVFCLGVLSSCSSADDYVPEGFKRISDDNADYRLYIPENWIADVSTGVTTAYVSDTDRSNISFIGFELDDAIINVVVPDGSTDGGSGEADAESSSSNEENTDVPEISTIDEYWEYYSSEFEMTFSDMEYSVSGEGTLISGNAAKKYVYTATVTGQKYKFMQVVTIKDGAVYIFTYTARENLFDEHIEDVNDIVGYIELK